MSKARPPHEKFARKVWWSILLATILCPWLVGAFTKIYLDAQGAPTVPWSYFLSPLSLPLLLIGSLWWGLPMIFVALMARTALESPGEFFSRRETLLIIGTTVAAGLAGMVRVLLPVFHDWDPMYFIVPLALYYVHWIAAGIAVGLVLASPGAAWRRYKEKKLER